eukprot:TRINITY_DN720_c0_g1_i2.p2 TRINITY_DN720_c0_g1~~TRINITY_DN720_c0_g1_i2.p2  ORF type:complete len:117 (+),score=31.58 TRINITY_DN720_c0_g1_i2:29-379(+)
MIRRPPRSTQSRSSAASDVYKRQISMCVSAYSLIIIQSIHPSPMNKHLSINAKRLPLCVPFACLYFKIVCSVLLNRFTNLYMKPHTTAQRSLYIICLLYTSPSPRDGLLSRMPSSA